MRWQESLHNDGGVEIPVVESGKWLGSPSIASDLSRLSAMADASTSKTPFPWQKALSPEALAKHGKILPDQATLTEFVNRLARWYAKNGRQFYWRKSRLRTYEVLITEALLQRTRADTVSLFLPTFLSRYPSWKSLAAADVKELELAIKPIGLQRRRAVTLSRLAQAIKANSGRIPSRAESLFSLPGVGQYLLYATRLYVRDEALPLLDASMARLLERYFGQSRALVDIRYDPYLQQLARKVVETGDHKKTNWAMLDVAAQFCGPRSPNCAGCPLRSGCQYAAVTNSQVVSTYLVPRLT